MKKITVFLSEQELSALYAITARTGLKFADVVRRIVDQGLEASAVSHWAQRRPDGNDIAALYRCEEETP